MDLLTTTGVVLAPRGRALRLGLGFSVAVHLLLAAVLLKVPMRAFMDDVPIEVAIDVVADVAAETAAPAPAGAVEAPPRRGPQAPRPSRSRAREPEPVPAPSTPAGAEAAAPTEEPAAEPDADATGAMARTPGVAVAASSAPAAAGGAGRHAGPAPPGLVQGGAGPPHRALVERYRTDVLGNRIRQVFRYPGEARELELEGRVLLKVAIARDGRLLDVRLSGACPHAILCADGLRTIRAAAPFPPLPADLGPSLTVEVPLTYAFAGG